MSHYIASYKRGASRVCVACRKRCLTYHMVQMVQKCGSKVWRCKKCGKSHRPHKKKQ